MSNLFKSFSELSGERPQKQIIEMTGVKNELREIYTELERLRLLSQAMWELLRDKVGLTDADLESKAQEVDLRDGIGDQQISKVPLRCPQCGRISSSKHWRCLYCGLEFEKPVMG